MKTAIEQVKGLGAWYVAASAFGRRRFGGKARERVVPKPVAGRACVIARRPATSGLMTLRAVCHNDSDSDRAEIIDFEWAYVSVLAARLLDHEPRDLIGRRLSRVLNEGAALFEYYRSVIEEGAREPIGHAHVADGGVRMLRHEALRLGEGVLVTLSDLSASRERHEPQIQWLPLDGAFGPATQPRTVREVNP